MTDADDGDACDYVDVDDAVVDDAVLQRVAQLLGIAGGGATLRRMTEEEIERAFTRRGGLVRAARSGCLSLARNLAARGARAALLAVALQAARVAVFGPTFTAHAALWARMF